MPRVSTGTVVCLHAGRIEEREAPAVGNQLPGIGRSAVCVELRKLKGRVL